ncbi:LOW QUALITY PROTEIN: nucleosome assembly protein 1;2 [Rosa chinensis]|uniref:LOW QUALITY PROTEIN: nucleosome assembly protein 1;2 n=1 Tax=Rosa chinensis TaxID=74649 RepID=UPI001AD8EF7E|nr:LOW QUALITY PROTEIN: nucleosome assembly protein 1;2 [Rosa chinensis]
MCRFHSSFTVISTIRDKIIENKDLAKDLLQELRFFRHGNYTLYKHRLLRLRYLEVGAQVEAAYLNLYKPIYEKRYEIVNGITKVGEKDEVRARDKGDEATKEKGIPQFWLTAMKNHKLLAQEITEHDEVALKYLKDIKWYRIYGGSFRLEFVFQQPNPYFENEVLTKSYKRPLMEKTTGCVIKWHHGKDLTHKFLEGMSKNSKRMTKSCESVFNFFNPPQLCLHEKHIDYNDGYLNGEVKSKLNYDFFIGKIIRDKIIPHAISWFTREALEPGGEFEDLQDDWYDYSDDDEDAEAIKNL